MKTTFKGSYFNSIYKWVKKHEIVLIRILHFVITLLTILVINNSFGYLQAISKPYFAVVFALLCAFLPLGGVALFLVFYLLIQMFAISLSVMLATLFLIVLFFILSVVFRARRHVYYAFMPALYRLNLIYIAPIEAGFMGSRSEVIPLIGGATLAFYLREVRLKQSQLTESDAVINVMSLIRENILGNQMFYVFLIAITSMFAIISFIRGLAVKRAWLLALISGIVLEFLIMFAGYMLTDNSRQILSLVIANVIAFVFGLVFALLFYDMDHSRTEKLQFEDDEYYYYVTAVPKIQFVQEEKDVKNITKENS